jgi:hypothetical protein
MLISIPHNPPITLQTTADHTWINVPAHLVPAFQKMVNKACNCWPDAPPEIKEFADLITSGQVYQDYRRQNTDQKQRPDTLAD